jgi:hypothetical protein
MPNPDPNSLTRVRAVAHAAVAHARDRLRVIDVSTPRPAQPPTTGISAPSPDGNDTVEALYRELAMHRAHQARTQLGGLLDSPDRLLAQSARALEDAAGALQHAAATQAPSGERTADQLDLQADGLLTVAACFEAAADLQRRH